MGGGGRTGNGGGQSVWRGGEELGEGEQKETKGDTLCEYYVSFWRRKGTNEYVLTH